MIDIVQVAAKKSGGLVALANQLGIKHQALYSWRHVPVDHVVAMERITGISRHDLRPDLSAIFANAEAQQ